MNKNSLAYSTKKINRNFRIKVAGVDNEGNKINMLVGVSGLLKLIGVELANKFLTRAFKSMDDSCVCKLRRGLKVTFYIK
ncbi:ribosomal large subunit pseudouridine synthase B [Bacteroides sp.]|uniref:ribosomal large subunit pseudouridine synthase B n=1 Tax=Bacteroides sp. TaxID=29523 RepID=UPI002A7FF7B8|nr:ribosomal large subunit pseudouridine synthase B [Bacteroides sp.]